MPVLPSHSNGKDLFWLDTLYGPKCVLIPSSSLSVYLSPVHQQQKKMSLLCYSNFISLYLYSLIYFHNVLTLLVNVTFPLLAYIILYKQKHGAMISLKHAIIRHMGALNLH